MRKTRMRKVRRLLLSCLRLRWRIGLILTWLFYNDDVTKRWHILIGRMDRGGCRIVVFTDTKHRLYGLEELFITLRLGAGFEVHRSLAIPPGHLSRSWAASTLLFLHGLMLYQ